jgi:hypothetical protein
MAEAGCSFRQSEASLFWKRLDLLNTLKDLSQLERSECVSIPGEGVVNR